MSAKPSILDQHRESRSIRRIPPATLAPAAADQFKTTPFPATSSVPAADNRLIVGPRVRLSGAKILDCDSLRIEGEVDATIDARALEIASGGLFNGCARLESADISGRFDGELLVTGRLKLRTGAQVHGKVRYGSLVVEADATLSGDVAPASVPDNTIALDRGERPSHASSITALLA